jgi:hypothetical protein
MKTAKIAIVTSSLLALAALAAPARAQSTTAEILYQEGRRAAQAKDWALACRKFKESQELEPAPGTLLNLADCEENRGALRDARAHFESAAQLFKSGDERGAYARQRASSVERRMPKLLLRLPATAPNGTTAERDGAPLAATDLNKPTALDPGDHVLVVHAPGRQDMRTTIRLAEADSREIELAVGAPAATGSVTPPPTNDVAPKAPATVEPVRPSNGDGSSARRTAGFAALGVGAIGLGAGLLGGLLTMNAKSTADSNCPAPGCNSTGLDAESRGKTWSTVSTVGFVAGGLGLATGAGLLWLWPNGKSQAAVSAHPNVGGAEVRFGTSF